MKSWRKYIEDLNLGQGLRAQLVRGVLAGELLSLPLPLGTSIFLARGMVPGGYGQYYMFVLSLMTMLALPVGRGIGQLVTREVAKYQHGEQWGCSVDCCSAQTFGYNLPV